MFAGCDFIWEFIIAEGEFKSFVCTLRLGFGVNLVCHFGGAPSIHIISGCSLVGHEHLGR